MGRGNTVIHYSTYKAKSRPAHCKRPSSVRPTGPEDRRVWTAALPVDKHAVIGYFRSKNITYRLFTIFGLLCWSILHHSNCVGGKRATERLS